MKLYNVTFHIQDTRTTLNPIIPDSTYDTENRTIPRVCLSDSIEHCIQALAPDNRNLSKNCLINVREANAKDIGKANIIKPEQLFKEGYVIDALENMEYWSIVPVRCDVRQYRVINFEAYFDLGWTIVTPNQVIEIIKQCTHGSIGVPVGILNSSKTSNQIYKDAMSYIYESNIHPIIKYKLDDAIWDRLTEIPYAQQLKVKSIRLQEVTKWVYTQGQK